MKVNNMWPTSPIAPNHHVTIPCALTWMPLWSHCTAIPHTSSSVKSSHQSCSVTRAWVPYATLGANLGEWSAWSSGEQRKCTQECSCVECCSSVSTSWLSCQSLRAEFSYLAMSLYWKKRRCNRTENFPELHRHEMHVQVPLHWHFDMVVVPRKRQTLMGVTDSLLLPNCHNLVLQAEICIWSRRSHGGNNSSFDMVPSTFHVLEQ